jgi:hypothetical protein
MPALIRLVKLENKLAAALQKTLEREWEDRLAVEQVVQRQLAVERLAVERLAVERLAVERLAVEQLAVEQLAVAEHQYQYQYQYQYPSLSMYHQLIILLEQSKEMFWLKTAASSWSQA